jgi:hypothetical protein
VVAVSSQLAAVGVVVGGLRDVKLRAAFND